ncbi:DUF6345 domain-containing protein [Paracoccus sp. DMF]|uniref:DUF6345 domain-containing protein n=1 Tax=Paracoccus sp. DMF TaxID=400837 RepID=UPI0021E3C29B|nr:DUF6345 domain-containing protein [Paracoccus sp. DMF]MCV2449236.1 DUF6345 domain-containing protein [Paracoccus sp. DMF]
MDDYTPRFGILHPQRAHPVPEADDDPDPAEVVAGGVLDAGNAASRLYGACSVETYRAAGALHAAHRDAEGFLDAVDGFATPEFWRRDLGVKSWIYDRREAEHAPGRDMDSVRVFYHAGHGRTDERGIFHLPMGALWNGADPCLTSERMRFGGGGLRYLFWSASQSLPCDAAQGQGPTQVWARANAGLRMMFGFDSSCWDSGQYGRNFWRHWRLGKSFSQAWLDGCGDVSTDQSPAVAACGDSRDEALDRLFHERRFRAAAGGGAWWAWRWHVPTPLGPREPGLATPPEAFSAVRLVPPAEDLALAGEVLSRIGGEPGLLRRQGEHGLRLEQGGCLFHLRPDGRILLAFAPSRPGQQARMPLQRRALVARARSALRRYGFLQPGCELVFDRVLLAMSASASPCRPDEPARESLDEIVVQFRQSFAGIPVLTPDSGKLRLTMRPDGTVLRIESSLRRMAELLPARAHRNGLPDDPAPPAGVETGLEPPAIPQMLAQHSARLMRDLAARGAAPLELTVLPGTQEIGYGIRSNTARLVARKAIEIECRRGFRKRYWIQSDLGD